MTEVRSVFVPPRIEVAEGVRYYGLQLEPTNRHAFGIPSEAEDGWSFVAYNHNNRRVGVLTGSFQNGVWRSRGTLVSSSWRDGGLALRLWHTMLDLLTPYAVDVPVASEAGVKLVKRLMSARPDLGWYPYLVGDLGGTQVDWEQHSRLGDKLTL